MTAFINCCLPSWHTVVTNKYLCNECMNEPTRSSFLFLSNAFPTFPLTFWFVLVQRCKLILSLKEVVMKIKDINKYESTYYSIKCSINMSHCLPHLPFHGACWLKTFWADLVGVQKPLGPYIFLSMQKKKKKKNDSSRFNLPFFRCVLRFNKDLRDSFLCNQKRIIWVQ